METVTQESITEEAPTKSPIVLGEMSFGKQLLDMINERELTESDRNHVAAEADLNTLYYIEAQRSPVNSDSNDSEIEKEKSKLRTQIRNIAADIQTYPGTRDMIVKRYVKIFEERLGNDYDPVDSDLTDLIEPIIIANIYGCRTNAHVKLEEVMSAHLGYGDRDALSKLENPKDIDDIVAIVKEGFF